MAVASAKALISCAEGCDFFLFCPAGGSCIRAGARTALRTALMAVGGWEHSPCIREHKTLFWQDDNCAYQDEPRWTVKSEPCKLLDSI